MMPSFSPFKSVMIAATLLLLGSCSNTTLDYSIPIDGDGRRYETVQIGTQTWMASPLTTTRFNDGTPITLLAQEAWNHPTNPAFCYYNNDPQNGAIYGALYNFPAVNTGKLAPKGWRVATSDDWNLLAAYLGGFAISGGKLKDIDYWKAPNTGATAESILHLLPSGYRDADGTFAELGEKGYWWTSSFSFGSGSWMRFLSYDSERLDGNGADPALGFAVLCIKE